MKVLVVVLKGHSCNLDLTLIVFSSLDLIVASNNRKTISAGFGNIAGCNEKRLYHLL